MASQKSTKANQSLRALTRSQQAFLRAYMADPSPIRAARAAGFSNPNYGYSLLNRPHIQARIAQMAEGGLIDDELIALKQRIVDELKAIAFSDPRDLLEPAEEIDRDGGRTKTMRVKSPHAWPEAAGRAVSRLRFYPADKGGSIMEAAFWPKGEAIKQLRQIIEQAEPQSPIYAPVKPVIRTFGATSKEG